MPNTTYIGREGTVTITPSGGGAQVVGLVEFAEITFEVEHQEVYGIGSGKPQDIKEDVQHLRASLRKAVIDATFWDRIKPDANGYQVEFSIEFKLLDKSGGGGAGTNPFIKNTVTGLKAARWSETIVNKGAVVMESLDALGKDATRTTGLE